VTLFRMDEGMDTGPLLLQRSTHIEDDETLDSLTERLAVQSADLLIEGLELLEHGEVHLVPQTDGASVAPKITKDEACIDWADDAARIERKIRALCSKPGASTTLDGRVLKIYGAKVLPAEGDATPGTVVRTGSDGVVVAAGSGWLSLTELQLEGRKRMQADSFLRGKQIPAGTRLG
jgi:methionyl-tRNA formyltransferase